MNWACDEDGLRVAEKSVLNAIAHHFNDAHDRCFPSYARICRDSGLSRRAVSDAVKSLEVRGLLKVERRGKAGGGRTTNNYYLPLYPNPKRKDDTGQRCTSRTIAPPDQRCTSRTKGRDSKGAPYDRLSAPRDKLSALAAPITQENSNRTFFSPDGDEKKIPGDKDSPREKIAGKEYQPSAALIADLTAENFSQGFITERLIAFRVRHGSAILDDPEKLFRGWIANGPLEKRQSDPLEIRNQSAEEQAATEARRLGIEPQRAGEPFEKFRQRVGAAMTAEQQHQRRGYR